MNPIDVFRVEGDDCLQEDHAGEREPSQDDAEKPSIDRAQYEPEEDSFE